MIDRMADIGLNAFKIAILKVLYEDQEKLPTPFEILIRLNIPQVKDSDGSETTLIRGILAHLSVAGYAKYKNEYAGWQITEEGVSFIEDSQGPPHVDSRDSL